MSRDWRTTLRKAWFEFDPRSLGIFRIGLALLLLGDLLRRVPDLAVWYSNQGLLPNHNQLWRPASDYVFSLFFLASHPGEAALGFVLCGLVYLGLLVGWKTRLFQVLSLVAVVSLHSRAIVLENGGDVVMNILVAWSCFLPLGRRFSLDSLLASLRAQPETTAADLAFDRRPGRPTAPVASIAVFALLLQFATIYFFNTVHKGGSVWREGSAIHYALHQDRLVTALGHLLRDDLPLWASKAMTAMTLGLEGAAPLLLLAPVAVVTMRRIAIAVLPAMHVGFAVFLNVGFFTPTMMTFFLLLPTAADWEAMGRAFRSRKGRAREVWFDAGCGVCFQVVRVLARLDAGRRLTLLGNDGRLPKGVTRELVESTIVVIDPATGRRWVRSGAFAEIFAALPGLLPLAWLLRVPGLRPIADRAYDLFAANRQRISVTCGLAACGLPSAAGAPAAAAPAREIPLVAALRRQARVLSEATVVLLILALGSQMLIENRAIPKALKIRQPEFFKAIVHYPRLFQGWSMFAPNPPMRDALVVVDARTVDGRRIDPLNLAASGWEGEPWEEIPERLGHDQFWCDYHARVRGRGALHGPLREWILRHHERTGDPNDRIVAFEAWLLEDDSPPPGVREPLNRRRERFLSHGKIEDAPGVARTTGSL